MTISDAIRTTLSAGGKSQGDLADLQEVSKQAVANKMARGTWSAKELVDVATLTGSKLLFEFQDGTRIIIDSVKEINEQK